MMSKPNRTARRAVVLALVLAATVPIGARAAESTLGGVCGKGDWGKVKGTLTCALVAKDRYAYVQTAPTTKAAASKAAPVPVSVGKTSRKNPAPIGATVTLKDSDNGNIDVRVDGYLANAAAAIKAKNQYNDPAPAGKQYGLVHLTLTYHAGAKKDKTSPFEAVSLSVFGVEAVERKSYDCSVTEPEEFDDMSQLLDGGKASGNLCFVMPIADATGPLTLRATEAFCFSNCDEAWFKLQ